MLRFIQRLPMWAVVPILFVVTGGVYSAMTWIGESHREPLGLHVVNGVFYGAAMTVVFSIIIARRRRRLGGTEQSVAAARALRTGVVPPDADPGRWIPHFERLRVQFRRNRWSLPVTVGLLAVACVWLAVEIDPLWLLFLIALAGLSVYSVFETRRALRNLDPILAELRTRSAVTPPVPGVPLPTPGASWPAPDGR